MRPPPVVTGISPAEGPPGTKVIIRGENLGINAKDVTGLSICGANCLLSADYKSAGKIIARTGQAKPGKGDVIVTTRSGGVGTSTVQFKSVMVVPDPLKESAVWLEEVDPEELRSRSGSARPVSPQINASQDPLGTGTDVFGYKLTEEQLEDFYPEGSGNILSDNFHPGWFLLEKHSDTEFITLRGGLKYLRREESRRAEDPLVFVKENVATFLDAVDTLRNVQHDMLRDESNCDGGSIVEKLESFVQGASKNAEGLFQDVLGRKDDADRTRNALNVLQRFRFLFSLPQCIERNIQLGEYEMVISDYGRAKSLFAGTDIKIFKRVLQEVEAKIEGFRQHLKVKLSDLPSPLEDQKRLIRYLVDLDYQGDPAWECLANLKDWLLKLLMSSQEDHKSKDSVPLLQVDSAKVDSDIRTSRSALSLASYRSESLGILGVSSPPNKTSSVDCSMKGVSAVPQRVLFVEELSELLIEGLPDLWKLGQAYFNGDLAADSSSGSSKQLNATEQKTKTFEDMIYDVASLYADLIKAAFFPSSPAVLSISSKEKQSSPWQSPADGVGAWLPSCVRHVRSCMESLQKLSLPPQALERIKKLVGDLRLLCAKEVFKEAIEDIKFLHCNELWSLESQEGVGRITSLPLMFENIVMETLHTLREMVTHGVETERRKNIQLKTSAVDLFKDMFEAFIECLQHLAFQPDQESDKVSLSGPQESSSIGSQDNLERSSLSTMEDSTPVIDERLLIVLNNCRYVRNNVLSKLVDCFRSNDYPVSDKLKKDLTSELNDLEGKIFDAYIEQKADPLIAYVEPGMTICDFKWHNCLPPKDVRSYVKEVLMNLVTVHAQVFAVSEELLTQVLCRLTDMLADEFCRLVSAVKTFTSAGAVTAHLEARAMKEALAAYLTQHSREMFQATFSKVPAITKDSDKRLIEALMTTFKRRMRFQLQCFQVDMEEL